MVVATPVERGAAISERLGQYVVSLRYEDLPAEVVEHTKDLLVNQLALAFSGRSTDHGRQAIALAFELSGGRGEAILVGERQRVADLDAIFAHSMLMGQDLDDHMLAKPLHIGRITHPVAWVLGQRCHVSGRALITAVVLGYDVAGRLAFPRMLRDYTYLAQNAFSPIAAAAVAARLLGLDLSRTAHAIAYSAHLGVGLVEGAEVATSGLIARDGVMAALLAQPRTAGLRTLESPRGLFARVFGRQPDGLETGLLTLGREFAIMEASTKRYPGSGSHILALELTKGLLGDAGARSQDVRSLVVTLSEDFRGRFEVMERIDRPDATEVDARRSLALKLAVLLARANIEPVPTLADLAEPAVRSALPKVELRFEADRPLDYGRVRLTFADGRVNEREDVFRPYPKGDWASWLRRDGASFLEERKLARLERLLTDLEHVEDVSEVMACTVPD